MLFNSYIFILAFLPITVIGYYIFNKCGKYKAAGAYLLLMSFVFYGYSNLNYLIMLVCSILINYLLIRIMSTGKKNKVLLWAGILFNLGILFVFKYFNFFIDNVNAVFKTNYGFLRLALPLGISFYTFQQLSYLIDYYHGDCERYSILEYANYVSFFPQLVAGPIVYHSEVIPQFRDEKGRRFNAVNFSKGIYAFTCGLAKKMLIADNIARVVNAGYANVCGLTSLTALITVVSYSLQLYYDFSGYSDMAYGLGYMFNIKLPVNFDSPFKSSDIEELWRKWHMTLTRFLTKYVYIPLGGSRKGELRRCVNILIVFLISGIWHGADWKYVLWGWINGVCVVLSHVLKRCKIKINKVIGCIVTFAIFVFSFIYFRADSIADGNRMIERVLAGGGPADSSFLTEEFNQLLEITLLRRVGLNGLIDTFPMLVYVVFLVIVLIVTFTAKNVREKTESMVFGKSELIWTSALLIMCLVSLSDITTFLYFIF